MRRRIARVSLIALAVGLTIVAASGLWLRARLRASLPDVSGERVVAALTAPVSVDRDAQGVVTVTGRDRRDVAVALGFVHAQERFFQMDTLRRTGAGELAELFGAAAVAFDRSMRVHRLREVARRVIAAAEPRERTLVEAYAEGVNAGLAALRERPVEYLLLRQSPSPWRPEDTALVLLAMFTDLQDERGVRESTRGVLFETLPPELASFLTPAGTEEWDAPVRGPAVPAPPVPGPGIVDLRASQVGRRAPAPATSPPRIPDAAMAGSNCWAVAGALTADGGAILANDMHLGLRVPAIWFRAAFAWTDTQGRSHRVSGVTLPGAPAMIVGSNGAVAWGFTNSYGDYGDLILIERDPGDSLRYRTPDGYASFELHREVIAVRGAPAETLRVWTTRWGPVLDEDHRGRPRAFRWTAHDPAAVDFRLIRMEDARDVDAALALAVTCGIPAQNFVVADAGGRIGWTVTGRIPRRVGFDGSVPASWADGTRRWDGWLAPDEVPRIVDPPEGRIWTANARVVDLADQARLGDGAYALGARARQIRDGLRQRERVDEADMLAIQLDDRALFLARWRDLALEVLPAANPSPGRDAFRRWVQNWDGRASVPSVGYRLVRAFRAVVMHRILSALTAPCRAADPGFDASLLPRREAPVWDVVSRRPEHLLPPAFARWDDFLLAAVDSVIVALADDDGALHRRTWGDRNTTRIRHPLGGAVPGLGRWLNMAPRPLPGDAYMPRVQSPGFGASERMVVSPGREEEGIFHMPCGQSGHPASPHYRDGHRAWEEGAPTPFLPGASVSRLVLRPR